MNGFHKRTRLLRRCAAVILAVQVFCLTFSWPAAAQNFVYDIDEPAASEDEFISNVYDTLNSTARLENRWTELRRRQEETERILSQIQSMPAPQGTDQSGWREFVQKTRREYESLQQQTSRALEKTRKKLEQYYSRKDELLKKIKESDNPRIKQLGALVGVSGLAAMPIWQRPTAQSIAATGRTAVNRAHLATVDARVPRYRALAQNRGAAAEAAAQKLANLKPQRWGFFVKGKGANAEYVLQPRGPNGQFMGPQVKTGIKAYVKNANGEYVKNPAAEKAAMDLSALRNSRAQLEYNINRLKLKASKTVNTKIKANLEKRVASLEKTKAKLEGEIAEYNANNPSMGQKLKALGTSAAKWAAFSAGITVSANVLGQMADNGWDIRAVDWRAATDDLRRPQFWGGVGGSFLGSMAASALASALPGGAFVKTFAAIGGAAVGWQAGSGQLGQTDWVQLGATTLGSTLGVMFGAAFLTFLGPLGPVIGGMMGHFVADWALTKLRNWLDMPTESFSRAGLADASIPGSGTAGAPGPIGGAYQAPGHQQETNRYGGGGGGGTDEVAQLKMECDQAYQAFIAAMQENPPDFRKLQQYQRRYRELRTKLEQARRAAASGR